MQEMRLSKFLAEAGVASRRACEEIIFAGRVIVNGSVADLPQTKVSAKDKILLDGRPIRTNSEKVYYMLNKPVGLICSNAGGSPSKRILSLFADQPHRLFTVGRLDKETSGLILVTNDGDFTNRVIHPSSNITKEYVVKTNKEITDEHLIIINRGMEIEGKWIAPKKVKKVRKGTIKISVAEGKKHEVRLLVDNAGLTVLELTRVRIGGLQLGTLPVGHWRPLSENDRASIFGESA